ncbi:MAG: carbohydrate ABC transporter permease [Actinobacteria bacterium]|nr:carbohydrate ABC transporter permease [Actinomycetota bacterium]
MTQTLPAEQHSAAPVDATRAWRLTKRGLHYLMLIALAAIFIAPFLILLSASLKPATQDVFSFPPDLIPRPPTIAAYVRAWTQIDFPLYLRNSFILVFATVPLTVIVCSLTAYPLALMRFPGRRLVFFALLASMFLPNEVMLIPLYLIVNSLGMINTFQGVILPDVLTVVGILMLIQAFTTVPRELSEAARIDGCGEWRIFWSVLLPVVRPTLAVVAIFGFINVWNDFLWPLVVLNDGSKYPVALGVAYLKGISGVDVRLLSAGAIIAIAPIVIFFVIMQRQVMEGAKGAVKG